MNSRDNNLERLEKALTQQGYEVVDKEAFLRPANKLNKIYAKEFKAGKNIFSRPFSYHFIINHPDCLAPLGFIYREQESASSGTAHYKLAFDLASVKLNLFNAVYVLGEGLEKGGPRDYLENQKFQTGQLVEVLSLDELEGFLIDIKKRYQPLP